MENLIGRVFYRLTVIGEATPSNTGLRRVTCRCECGQTKVVHASALKSGHSKSCGCLSREKSLARSTKHDHSHDDKTSPTYNSWRGMLDRCRSKNHKLFHRYGGRGITVCERWCDFRNFLADMGERPSKAHSIDRIDVDGNYEASNCRWATRKEQNENTARTVFITVDGQARKLVDVAREIGCDRRTLWELVYSGKNHEDAVRLAIIRKTAEREAG